MANIRMRGPQRHTPFRRSQRVVISNDIALFAAVVVEPQFNVNYDEILRHATWGCQIEIKPQEGLDAFFNDVANFNKEVCVNHSRGMWKARVVWVEKKETILLTLRGN